MLPCPRGGAGLSEAPLCHASIRMPPTAFHRLTLCTTAALLLPGCGSPGIPGWLNAALCRRKPASLAQWNRGSAARPVLLSSAKACTAMLFEGGPVQVELKSVDARVVKFQLKQTSGTGIGSAVPVSGDGYFLTAAHCAGEPERLTLVCCLRSS